MRAYHFLPSDDEPVRWLKLNRNNKRNPNQFRNQSRINGGGICGNRVPVTFSSKILLGGIEDINTG